MRFVYNFIFLSLAFLSNAQSRPHFMPGYRYLKLSFNRGYFGTGDVLNYSINTEYSVRLAKHSNSYWKHFQLGGELGFELGLKEPVLITPTISTSPKSFQHITNGFLEAKLSYYPISSTFLKGLHLAVGATGGYYADTYETYNTVIRNFSGDYSRISQLNYNDYAYIGYRVTVGYEYEFNKWLIGARMDFSNNTKGDGNITYGLKTGWKL